MRRAQVVLALVVLQGGNLELTHVCDDVFHYFLSKVFVIVFES